MEENKELFTDKEKYILELIHKKCPIPSFVSTETLKKIANINNILLLDNIKFNYYELYEIILGAIVDIDFSIYAKSEFNDTQMQQIRIGLEKGLDVSIYTDPTFNDEQMKQLRFGLENEINTSIYAKTKFDSYLMMQIKSLLLQLKEHTKKRV